MVNTWQAIILGIIQGAAEFLPISSSGHLALAQQLMGLKNLNIAFDVFLHLGTLLAVLFVFYKDIIGVIVAFFKIIGSIFTKGKLELEKSPYRKLVLMLLLASIPLVIGAILQDKIAETFNMPILIGAFLIVTSIILFVTNKLPKGNKTEKEATFWNALIVGCAQLVAVLPGISRSGTTIFAGITQKFKPEFAVKFSFLLSAIAILGATALSVKDITSGSIGVAPITLIIGVVTAAVVGYLSIKLLTNLVSKGKYIGLAIYCALVGVVTIIVSIVA